VFRGKDGATLTAARLYTKLTGVDIASADSGKVPAGVFADPAKAPGDPTIILQARLGIAQMTSGLMSALFDLQGEDKNRT
jgi:hypothetical protein